MNNILLTPPMAFIIVFIASLILTYLFGKLSFKKKSSLESKKAYACGEDFKDHMIQPDYSQFFPFAFFFTILHVVVLVIATVPVETKQSFIIAFFYILGAIISLIILLRR